MVGGNLTIMKAKNIVSLCIIAQTVKIGRRGAIQNLQTTARTAVRRWMRSRAAIVCQNKKCGAISTAARCVSSAETDDFGFDVAFEYVLHPISLLLLEIITHNGIKIPERLKEILENENDT